MDGEVSKLTDEEAWALAEFTKRIGWSEIRQNAVSDDQAYLMRDGVEKLSKILAAHGYNPR